MERDETATKADALTAPIPAPVIVDLGKRSKKAIKRLKRGTGRLMLEVEDAVEQVRLRLPESERDRQIIPVLVLYGRKQRRNNLPSVPFSPLSLFR